MLFFLWINFKQLRKNKVNTYSLIKLICLIKCGIHKSLDVSAIKSNTITFGVSGDV